jgi:imidazole glycerol-phosphate synthase subunit HisH
MEKKKVIILDYQLGNLFSVQQACNAVGLNAIISSDKQLIEQADAIILPGVGAFNEAMKNLESLDLIAPLKDFVSKGNPLFGICLGQQLLFTESEEFGSGKGLNFIDGVIRKFPTTSSKGELMKVPQIAWNRVWDKNNLFKNSPLKDISNGEFMYFVHSYYVIPEHDQDILTVTKYEELEYCSAILKNNIFATQFHPEKSSELGVNIYKNWALQYNLI